MPRNFNPEQLAKRLNISRPTANNLNTIIKIIAMSFSE
jgi:hypothetical protein